MGILKAHMHILGMELSKESFISGNVLILSQQSVWNTLEGTKKIFKKYGLDLKNLDKNFKTGNLVKSFTEQEKTKDYINIYALMKLLGADSVSTIDVSPYENVDIIHDMSYPINKEYHDKFDFIFDSGSLEHIFNVPQALENISKMLKVGGTFFLSVPSSNYIDHGFYSISPTLFFDYFEANGFNQLRGYIRIGSSRIYDRKSMIYKFNHLGKESFLVTSKAIETNFIAKKTSKFNPEIIKMPIQKMYTSIHKKQSEDISVHKNQSSLKSLLNFIKLEIKKLFLRKAIYIPYHLEKYIFNRIRKNSLEYVGRF